MKKDVYFCSEKMNLNMIFSNLHYFSYAKKHYFCSVFEQLE